MLVDTAQNNIGNARRATGRTAILSYLKENAQRYFAEFNNAMVDIRLVSEQQRLQSHIYRFELKAKSRIRFLRVKVPLYSNGPKKRDGDRSISYRPRRFPPTDPGTKFKLEYAALGAIHNYFYSLQDPRFGTVRILDSLPDIGGNVMEEVGDPSLRQLFAKETRLSLLFRSARSHAAFSNAGAWLREYHSLPNHAEARHILRADFVESITTLTDYLAAKLADAPFFRSVASEATAVALDVLPESLPVGLGHGDFALRNILVGPAGRVTVLDTLARWRTPIFEDIGYFLTNLKMTWPQIMSQGRIYDLNLMAQYERAFLVGYFGNNQIPLRVIGLYQIQALVDTWSGRVARGPWHRGVRYGPLKQVKHALQNRYFKKNLAVMLKAIS